MRPPRTDAQATVTALRHFGLPPCLHVPIGAIDTLAIENYIGTIEGGLTAGPTPRALLVKPYTPSPPDRRLPIWRMAASAVFHLDPQIWVHVDYRGYRRAYCDVFGTLDGRDVVLDHVMNRRVARIKGMQYVRIVPISRASNSNSGAVSERYGFGHHMTPTATAYRKAHPASIQYADLADLVKMMDIMTGGSFQNAVNDGATDRAYARGGA
jgi:hypothetical protein